MIIIFFFDRNKRFIGKFAAVTLSRSSFCFQIVYT